MPGTYVVSAGTSKEVTWDCYRPTLAEIREAAAKEFPSLTDADIHVDVDGWDAEFVVLKPVDH